jgi:hypothetical protein
VVNNNNLIFNAALAGFLAGAFGGTVPTASAPASGLAGNQQSPWAGIAATAGIGQGFGPPVPAGGLAGSYGFTVPAAIPSSAVTAAEAAAAAWAKELDSLIPNDGTISGGAGVTLVPSTAAISSAQLAKTELAYKISFGFSVKRLSQDPVAADYALGAASAAVIYNLGVTGLTIG